MNRAVRRLKLKNRLGFLALSGLSGGFGGFLVTTKTPPGNAAFFLAVSVYLALLLAASFRKKTVCVIHPYFSRKLSTELPCTAFNGNEIAVHLDELDDHLHANGFRSISDFGYQQINIRKMHRPADLLKSLQFLLQNDSLAGTQLRRELCRWVDKISIARDEGAFVAIHLRIADGVSGLEIDRLQGTY
jgi:hypothetical protein